MVNFICLINSFRLPYLPFSISPLLPGPTLLTLFYSSFLLYISCFISFLTSVCFLSPYFYCLLFPHLLSLPHDSLISPPFSYLSRFPFLSSHFKYSSVRSFLFPPSRLTFFPPYPYPAQQLFSFWTSFSEVGTRHFFSFATSDNVIVLRE